MNGGPWKIWIDTGGTFTDCIAYDPEGNQYYQKLLSRGVLKGRLLRKINPESFEINVNWGLSHDIFHEYHFTISGIPHHEVKVHRMDFKSNRLTIDSALDISIGENTDFEITTGEEAPVLAARLVTGTPLSEPLPPIHMRLGSTIGTNALLERKGAKTLLVVTEGFKDLLLIGNQQRDHIFDLRVTNRKPLYHKVVEIGARINSEGHILDPVREEEIRSIMLSAEPESIESVAISLLHSYVNPDQEITVGQVFRDAGYSHITMSAEVAPLIHYLNRTETTVVNAYLEPLVRKYLDRVYRYLKGGKLLVMTSAGGLVSYQNYHPKESLFSGPAGGIVGAAEAAAKAGINPILSFDMGGTSTDVSRYDKKFEYQYVTRIGDATIVSPSLHIETVASGGGSICAFDGIRFSVGPHSAGSLPGPACYGSGGPLTITDVNLLLGRLDADNFGIPINRDPADKMFKKLTSCYDFETNHPEKILEGFLQITNEQMATAIRKISIDRGYDPSEHTLVSFGGAGGQHACDIAEILNIGEILVPYDAGLLSATGIGHARVERFSFRQVLKPLSFIENNLEQLIDSCAREAVNSMQTEDIQEKFIIISEVLIYLRFLGQEATLEINYKGQDIEDSFRKIYEQTYGHWIDNREIEVESIKVIASEKREDKKTIVDFQDKYQPDVMKYQDCWLEGSWQTIPVFTWEELQPGAMINGPALLISRFTVVLVKNHWKLEVNIHNQAVITYFSSRGTNDTLSKGTYSSDDSIQIELFTNRFIAIAEEMGALLRRSSFSVNIKERLDYSCALLDSQGYLIVNAPHIPVHLGGLGLCVRSILQNFKIKPGQVYITNHPGYGGSHLPDITLLAPVFDEDRMLAGFVANRAHHAELGGKRPGSMPPDASNLVEEGIVIPPFCLVEKGKADWHRIRQLLTIKPYPSRSLEENIADLTGALASIQSGSKNLADLCRKYGTGTIRNYMDHLKKYANTVLLSSLKKLDSQILSASERLDDGNKIQVVLRISGDQLTFDFSGTSGKHPGNLNATPAIVRSAVLYVLRLLIDENIPLNEGLMQSVSIQLPDCFLNPGFPEEPEKCPAVVGGNTETSQRLVDTLLKALGLAACSQGTMNNFLFGNDRFSYYETIGGGIGAAEGHNGASALHQHMTNTRITDPEVLEFRYPVRLDRFGIRKNSGGDGKWKGGNGIIRKITFLESLEITLLSQHRIEAPYGIRGGAQGMTGNQFLVRKDGSIEQLDGIDASVVHAGDSITLLTPGGGGYGKTF